MKSTKIYWHWSLVRIKAGTAEILKRSCNHCAQVITITLPLICNCYTLTCTHNSKQTHFWIFRSSGICTPCQPVNIPEDLDPQQQCSQNPRSCTLHPYLCIQVITTTLLFIDVELQQIFLLISVHCTLTHLLICIFIQIKWMQWAHNTHVSVCAWLLFYFWGDTFVETLWWTEEQKNVVHVRKQQRDF